ncbi:MAG: Transposase [Firmicutes bacterium]|nr:Transposase [Bacillota bacterium]
MAELDGLKQLPNEAHTKAACRLRAHSSYGKYLRQLKDGTLKLNKEAIRDEERYDGEYLIRTSDDTLSPEDVALGYKQLVDVENAFRTLKTTLELRPMYHRLEDGIRAHILISWLALLLVRIAEAKTGSTWPKLRDELERLHLGHFSSKNGDLYQSTKLTVPLNSVKPLRLLGLRRLRGSLKSNRKHSYTHKTLKNARKPCCVKGLRVFYLPSNCRTRVS